MIKRVAEFSLPSRFGIFDGVAYEVENEEHTHVAMVMGNIQDGQNVLVRVHSECLTGDAFGSLRCDCGPQRDAALEAIAKEGRGVFLYLRQEGRGIGLGNKLRAYELQDQGADTVDANLALGLRADERSYVAGARMLLDLGIQSIRLLTNNPEKVEALEAEGIIVTERVPILTSISPYNQSYLQVKRERMGHLFDREYLRAS